MPNRIIKESVNESSGLAITSPFAQDLFKRLITYADDYGRFNSHPEIMRARLYPLELDAVTVQDVEAGLIELVGVEKVRLYENKGRPGVFGYFPGWDEHQRVRHTRARCPEPGTGDEVNDWALQRFVPMLLRRRIFERDKFKCQECGISHKMPGVPLAEAQRALSSVFHIDHIVPVLQGGRATEENLRLLCRRCNAKRPKTFDWSTGTAVPRSAASCGELPPESNPIRIQSESNPIPKAADAAMANELPAALLDRIPEMKSWPSPEALVALWNDIARKAGLPLVTTLSASRRDNANRMLRQFKDWQFWTASLSRIPFSQFLTGRVAPTNGHSKPFRADFDWICAKKDGVENIVKLHDGKYDEGER
ncbi:MAG TPA: HNH endonuclease signature motif containing protein [Terriglobales bacterium]|nr:HNH endonuclease signature motif containing protein [Terriglobales bacterium]